MILLDAGLVTELDAVDRRNFLDLFRAVAVGDGRLAAQLMIERSRCGPPTRAWRRGARLTAPPGGRACGALGTGPRSSTRRALCSPWTS